MHQALSPELLAGIGAAAGLQLKAADCRAVTGGDISGAYRCRDAEGTHWFLKINQPAFVDAFAAEAAGLGELACGPVRVPRALAWGVTAQSSWLVLEWLPLQPLDSAAAALGLQLAEQHRRTAGLFGGQRDNYIGTTPQHNPQHHDWVTFFAECRLRPQLELAREHGARSVLVERGCELLLRLPDKLAGYSPPPSLLHGDLWGGNAAQLPGGDPVIFDPAVYYGDRETDLAMTRLFGGFPERFYEAYEAAWPLEQGYEYRCMLYQLYHVLNHGNLFGGAYFTQAAAMIDTLLGENP